MTANVPSQSEETAASCTEEQAQALRAALDDELERVRSLSLEDHLEFSAEDQLMQLVVLTTLYPDDALSKAVLMTHPPFSEDDTTNIINNTSYSGRLPIHLACDTNAPIEIIQWLLEHDKTDNKRSILQRDKWGDLPIHTACSRKDTSVVKLLLESDSDNKTIMIKDNDGALPIHMACRYVLV